MSCLLWMPLHAQSSEADQQSVDAQWVDVVEQPLEGVRQGRLLEFTLSARRREEDPWLLVKYFSKTALVYPVITPMVAITTACCVCLLSQKPLMSYRHYILIRYLDKPVVSLCFHVRHKLQWIKKLSFMVWMLPTAVCCASQGDNTFSRLKSGKRTLLKSLG